MDEETKNYIDKITQQVVENYVLQLNNYIARTNEYHKTIEKRLNDLDDYVRSEK